jgi:hypothetical protein
MLILTHYSILLGWFGADVMGVMGAALNDPPFFGAALLLLKNRLCMHTIQNTHPTRGLLEIKIFFVNSHTPVCWQSHFLKSHSLRWGLSDGLVISLKIGFARVKLLETVFSTRPCPSGGILTNFSGPVMLVDSCF